MIDSKTQLYGILGNPVRHSKSPAVHNACFKHHHVNAVYMAFEIDDISKAVAALKTLNIQGASITIPFKESIMDHLDWIDDDALTIGAVNTLKNISGRLHGYNTDHAGALVPLKPFGIKDKTVCLVGAGGAAQAIAYGIHKEKGKLVIVNRNRKRGEALALKYNGDFMLHKEADKIDIFTADMLINATPVGMTPDVDGLSFPSNLLNSRMVVMDIVYSPKETRLLSEARKKGCKTIDGLSMFFHQAAAQFNLWTGITPDMGLMQKALIKNKKRME